MSIGPALSPSGDQYRRIPSIEMKYAATGIGSGQYGWFASFASFALDGVSCGLVGGRFPIRVAISSNNRDSTMDTATRRSYVSPVDDGMTCCGMSNVKFLFGG